MMTKARTNKSMVKTRWPKAYAVRYPHNGVWHIGDGYGGYECDLGSGDTAAAAWADAYRQENERATFSV